MNVAFFASAFHPHMGGVEEHVRQISHLFQRKGITPIVITNRWPRSLPRYEEFEGIPVYRLALRVPEGSLKARLNYRLTHQNIRREMLRILRKHNTNLLHIHCVSANGYYALLAKQALRLPLVVSTHGERMIDSSQLYQRSAFMNRVLRELLTVGDYITACSGNTLEDMEQYFGKPFGAPACVVYGGVGLDDFRGDVTYSHARPYIFGIGRLVAQKGFDILIRAFAEAKISSHDLLIAGDGKERENLEQLVHELGLGERVKFLGSCDRSTTAALFKGCSFFVLASRDEPFGLVNLEAMASGKAVIASRVGGVPEIVCDNQTGLLVPPQETKALAEAMRCLAANPELRATFGAAGQKRVGRFAWPVIADQYLDIYEIIRANAGQASPS